MSEQPPTGRDEVEVAHEALIRSWPRLRGWLDADRAGLLLRESVREAAQDWDDPGTVKRDPGLLIHQGQRLRDAEALALNPRVPLNARERAYVAACVAQRERTIARRRRVRIGVVAASLAVAVVASALAGWAWWERGRAEDQRSTAVAEADARATEVVVRAAAEALAATREAGSRGRAVDVRSRGRHRGGGAGRSRRAAKNGRGTAQGWRRGRPKFGARRPWRAKPRFSINWGRTARSTAGSVRRTSSRATTTCRREGRRPRRCERRWMIRRSSRCCGNEVSTYGPSPSAPTDATWPPAADIGTWPGTRTRESVYGISAGPARRRSCYPGPKTIVFAVAFSPDGTTLATTDERAIWLWKVPEPDRGSPPALRNSESGATSLAFSHDGRILAAATYAGPVAVWNLGRPNGDPSTPSMTRWLRLHRGRSPSVQTGR